MYKDRNEIIKEFKKIGFTEYEAKLYLLLLQKGELNGYQAAKYSEIPKANTYSALNSLTEKGYAYRIEEDSTRFVPRIFTEIASNKVKELESSLKFIEDNLPKRKYDQDNYLTIEGTDKIVDKILHMIENTREKILLDLWAEDFNLIKNSLLTAQKRGVKLFIVYMGDDNKYSETNNIGNIYIHEPSNGGISNDGRDFTMTCDHSEAISGSIGDVNGKAIYSSNKSFINLAVESIAHDILLTEATRDCSNNTRSKISELETELFND